MNKALIGPIVSILYLLLHDIMGYDVVTEDALLTTINTLALIVSGVWAIVGIFTHPKKKE